MNRITKIIAVGFCVVCMQFAYAQNECPKPCPPKPCCPQPCPPKPCCPKPCKPPCPPVCFERGYPDMQCCIPTAYNEPADFELSPCPWDFWFDASFTYWTAYQDGMEVAQSFMTLAVPPLPGFDFLPNSEIFFQGTQWKPGFKVGFGFDTGHDNWAGFAEYTWFRSTVTSSSGDAPEPVDGATTPVYWSPSNLAVIIDDAVFPTMSSSWKVNMDLLDVALTRPYYQGHHLIVAPFAGVRATWIRQNWSISGTSLAIDAVPDATASAQSHSWAIGPRGGMNGKWHLGWGFRIEADAAASIAYTRYSKINLSVPQTVVRTPVLPDVFVQETNFNAIRFNNDMSLGLGWGDYFDCRNYHLDFLVSYDFQIFWNQNMIRALGDFVADGSAMNPGNLYLQGLTVRAQFDF